MPIKASVCNVHAGTLLHIPLVKTSYVTKLNINDTRKGTLPPAGGTTKSPGKKA